VLRRRGVPVRLEAINPGEAPRLLLDGTFLPVLPPGGAGVEDTRS
jgi:hypothetical protein